MGRNGKIKEKDLKEKQNKFYEALDSTTPVEKYFDKIDDWIQYADVGNQPYTASHIIKNAFNTVLGTGLYTKPSKM